MQEEKFIPIQVPEVAPSKKQGKESNVRPIVELPHVTYTKIQTLYERRLSEKGPMKNMIIPGQFSRPEFEYLFDAQWDCYEKIDGSNTSIYWDGTRAEIHGKTADAQMGRSLIEFLATIFTPEKLNAAFPRVVMDDGTLKPILVRIYGEAFGGRIQDVAKHYSPDRKIRFALFDISINGMYQQMDMLKEKAAILGVETAPYIGRMPLREAEKMVIEGFPSVLCQDGFEAEGLVCRPAVDLFSRKGERVIVKIKTCDYRKLDNAQKAQQRMAEAQAQEKPAETQK